MVHFFSIESPKNEFSQNEKKIFVCAGDKRTKRLNQVSSQCKYDVSAFLQTKKGKFDLQK